MPSPPTYTDDSKAIIRGIRTNSIDEGRCTAGARPVMPHFDYIAMEERVIAAHKKMLCLLFRIPGKQYPHIAIAETKHHGCIVCLSMVKRMIGLRRKHIDLH